LTDDDIYLSLSAFDERNVQHSGENLLEAPPDLVAGINDQNYAINIPYGLERSTPDIFHPQPPHGLADEVALTLATPLISPSPQSGQTSQQSEESSSEDLSEPQDGCWPEHIDGADLIPWFEVYFERLNPILPVLNKTSFLSRILAGEHKTNNDFGSMVLALCAFALMQPINTAEEQTLPARNARAKKLMTEATVISRSFDFGESPTIDTVLASFFLFRALLSCSHRKAARFRLREAVDLALSMAIDSPNTYEGLSTEETSQRMRLCHILYICERCVTSWGHIWKMADKQR
jgi:hypothetical protein